jgi:Sulfotransferase domain
MVEVAWVVSYPKSGNTWVRFMLTSYLTNAAVTSANSIQTFVPDFQRILAGGELLPTDGQSPLLVKTHFLPSSDILQLYRTRTTKVVYLIRNPRDILLSLVRHMGIGRDDKEKLRRFAEDFVENQGFGFLRDKVGFGSWPQNVVNWGDPEVFQQHFPNADLHVVTYEDLKTDPVGGLHDIVDFLGLRRPIVDDDVRKAAENSSLEKMRDAERNTPSPMPGISPFGSHGPFIGEGNSNQSLAFIGDDVEAAYQRLAQSDGEFAQLLKKFGYDS